MSKTPVGFDKRVREIAKAESKALFCISINREYCTHLPDDRRGMMTMWGPADDVKAAKVSRLLLQLTGCTKEAIDELYPPEPEPTK
jgi:hypothetical protein